MNSQDILIVFSDWNLPYSPSTLALYDSLEGKFNIKILSFEPDKLFSSQRVINRNVEYIKRPSNSLWFRFLQKFWKLINNLLNTRENLYYLDLRAKPLVKNIKGFKGQVIAVDFLALWCTLEVKKNAHLLSLEIYESDKYKDACDFAKILSVIIQTKERYNYLFGSAKLKCFFIQNAPVYSQLIIETDKREPSKLLFFGSALEAFGIFNCIEFLNDYPQYSLTIKGAVPPKVRKVMEKYFAELIMSGRLILDEIYLDSNQVQQFISNYRIGFVFYDYYRFEFIDKFNYHTGPSGKLFQYYNAGLPVIGNRISGLSSVEEFKCGVLIETMGSLAIKGAIDKIEAEYFGFSERSKAASIEFDFKKASKRFVDYLIQFE